MKVIHYTRVSTEDQSSTGVSLAAQRQKTEQYCQLYDHQVIDFVEDAGLSAKSLNRPGIQKILEMVRKKQSDGDRYLSVTHIFRQKSHLHFDLGMQ